MSIFWDERYGTDEYIYGKLPNRYFKQVLDTLPPGRILVPGAGEGRDAVYAATLGWQVVAFDSSDEGCRKARLLAAEQGVTIDYHIADLADMKFANDEFDAIAMVFFHLIPDERVPFHQHMVQALKPGGTMILQAFTQNQLRNTSGGPKLPELLYDTNMMAHDFGTLDIKENLEVREELHEGRYHQGLANMIQLNAKKPLL